MFDYDINVFFLWFFASTPLGVIPLDASLTRCGRRRRRCCCCFVHLFRNFFNRPVCCFDDC